MLDEKLIHAAAEACQGQFVSSKPALAAFLGGFHVGAVWAEHELRPRWGVPERPTVPGEYDFRYLHPDGSWEVGRMTVTERMIVEGFVDDGTQWSGPIPVPLEPETSG